MVRTLIVEDNRDFRQSLREMLQSEFPSMEIGEAIEGEGAMHKIATWSPHLIFMDIKLPGENGLTLTKRIKTHHPHTIVIILTSHDLPEYRDAARQFNANYFISKNSPTTEILAVVRTTLLDLEKEPGA